MMVVPSLFFSMGFSFSNTATSTPPPEKKAYNIFLFVAI